MKLIRWGSFGAEKPGVLLEDGTRRDLSEQVADWGPQTLGSERIAQVAALVRADPASLPLVTGTERWGAPIARPGKVICIGLNYSDHAAETGIPVPAEPIIFLKGSNTVVGPYDDIHIPRGGDKTDWEVELGVVIGREARYLDLAEDAPVHIAGYVLTHDVSERAFQMERGGQWTKGKSCDTFNPLGPFLLVGDETGAPFDPKNLDLTLSVNGDRCQTGNTRTMVFDVFFLVHYLSQFMTLEPGDLISTGTPPGVGLGMKPPRYLKPGDVVELAAAGLGSQRQRCVSAPLRTVRTESR